MLTFKTNSLHAWLITILTYCAGMSADPAQMLAQERLGGTNTGNITWNYGQPSWSGANWLGSTQLPTQDWRLGVQVDNLNTGVMIRQVTPNSAAARANMEVNDVIVTVAGQQVGIIDGQPIDLGTEIKRRADSTGNVTLLVQDGRTGRLASVRVRLDGNQSVVRGQVTFRERLALPADALATVTIENVSRPFYVVRNGETSAYVSNRAVVPFQINYDPAYIDPNDIYQVRARVSSAGRIICDTIQPIRVFGSYPSDNLQLVVASVASPLSGGTTAPVISAGYGSNDALIAQYRQIYRRYLGRDPSDLEIAALMVSPTMATDLEALPISLMASQQYYDAVGNNDASWITSVFQQIIGRPPSNQERDQWLNYFVGLRGSRVELLRQLYRSKR